MILIVIGSIIAAAVAYVMTSRLPFGYRAVIAGVIFIAMNAPNIVVLVVGDQPLEGARTITKEELKDGVDAYQ